MSQFERLIKRDRTHASIFMWSIGNEEFGIQTTSYGKRIAQSLLAKQKELDPTRTSTYAADVPNVFEGVNEVIPGWTEALQLMPVGSKWKLYIPSNIGYGDFGAGQDIPGGATLVFEVELLGISNKK